MAEAVDPFTAVYQAIQGAIAGWPALAALVAPLNRVDTTLATFEQFVPDATSADRPRLTLLQEGFRCAPASGNSLSATIEQDYRVVLLVDTLRTPPLNQIKYQLLRALLAAGPTLGVAYVERYTVSDARDAQEKPPRAGPNGGVGSLRWMSSLLVSVTFYLPRSELINPNV